MTTILWVWLIVASVVNAMLLSALGEISTRKHGEIVGFWDRTAVMIAPCFVMLAVACGVLKLVNWIIGN